MPDTALAQRDRMTREHAAWLDVIAELRTRGIIDMELGGKDEDVISAITKWGEELAQLRLNDPHPQHADMALTNRRQAYPGQYERGTYPEGS